MRREREEGDVPLIEVMSGSAYFSCCYGLKMKADSIEGPETVTSLTHKDGM